MFNDENWIKKLIIGGIISIIPFVNFILYGYLIDVIKYSINGVDNKLPEFNYFDQFLKGIIVLIIFMVPIIIFYIIFIVIMLVLFSVSNNSDSLYAIMSIFMVLAYIILFFGLLVLYLFLFIGITIYADTGNFYSVFNLKKILKILKNTIIDQIIFFVIYYIILTILTIVVYILALICMVTVILIPVAFWLFGALMYYSFVTMGYFYGKMYLKGLNKLH